MIIKEDMENYGRKILTIEVNDSEGQIEDLLDYISDIASSGHSFNVAVDPYDDDYKKEFWIDGDGSDRLEITSSELLDNSNVAN